LFLSIEAIRKPMSWLQFIIIAPKEEAEEYSEYMTNAGAAAVTLEDAAETPLFEPKPGTTPLWGQNRIIGLFEADSDIVNIKKYLYQHLNPDVAKTLQIETLADKNWTRAWIDHFQPMRFGEKLWICPSWCPIPEPEAINILLDPGMAWGTGTHPTTRLCLEWLEGHPPEGLLVVDYGCGSGILGVAALKLRAREVIGVDYDPQALESTKQNAKRNGFQSPTITAVFPEDFKVTQKADLILANILANPLIELASTFAALVSENGKIVLSGLLEDQVESTFQHYKKWFKLVEVAHHGEWARLSAIRLKS
jgi:ribosomal protein L11 methyltransferase